MLKGLFGDKAETVEGLTKLLETAEARFTQALGELEAEKHKSAKLEQALARAKTATTKAKAQVQAHQADKLAKPRAIGPLPDDKILAEADLLELIAAAEKVELAFSDGKRELFAPLQLPADAFKANVVGLVLTIEELMLEVPGEPKRSRELAGYGLLLDGELVAYRARFEPLELKPGSRTNLAGDIVL